MENKGEWEKMKNMINEVMAEGKEYAEQLQFQLNSSSSSQETREHLANKILESYHKSLTIISSAEPHQDSPLSHGGGSPKSEDSNQDRHVTSSKKAMLRWKKKVRITPGAGIETTLDDGFSWRKYGQKDILGAKFPRGYYRCTDRHSQGCLATKQVQRSGDDPMLFDITYRGKHSCSQASNIGGSSTFPVDPSVQDQEPNVQTSPELENLRGDLRIVTEGLEMDHHHIHQHQQQQQQQEQPHHFPSSSNNAYNLLDTTDNIGLYGIGYNSDNGGYNFPVFHQEMITHHHDIASASPSTSNSPTTALDSPFGSTAFDPNFPFGRFGGFFS